MSTEISIYSPQKHSCILGIPYYRNIIEMATIYGCGSELSQIPNRRSFEINWNRMAGYNIAKRIVRFIHFLLTVYLIRFDTKIVEKYSYYREKMTFIRTRYRQNQHLWCQNGVIMSLGNRGVFQLLKEMTFRRNLVFYSS